MPDEQLHKCSECGFLAARSNDDYISILEVEEDFRENGVHRNGIYKEPFCLMRRRQISEEFHREFKEERYTGTLDSRAIWRRLVQADYPCNDFVKWEPSFSPKEHREMLDREWRLKHEEEVRQIVWAREDKRDQDNAAREDKRDQDQATAHNEQMRILREQHRTQLIVFGGFIGLATVVSSVLGALIERGTDLWPW